ncbi:MAG: hypothetical protein V4738_14135 [Pseudomonadota bacterium]
MPADNPMCRDQEYLMPCAEALLAGTLALMTVQCRCHCERQREVMSQKIISNLVNLEARLCAHPLFSDSFQAVVRNVRQQWEAQQPAAAMQAGQTDRRLWHTTAESVQ